MKYLSVSNKNKKNIEILINRDQLCDFEVSLMGLARLLSIAMQSFACQDVVILNPGHHLSNPMDIYNNEATIINGC